MPGSLLGYQNSEYTTPPTDIVLVPAPARVRFRIDSTSSSSSSSSFSSSHPVLILIDDALNACDQA